MSSLDILRAITGPSSELSTVRRVQAMSNSELVAAYTERESLLTDGLRSEVDAEVHRRADIIEDFMGNLATRNAQRIEQGLGPIDIATYPDGCELQ